MAMDCIGNPDILILDEPTTGLDPASRRQVWELIENVKEGSSVVSTCIHVCVTGNCNVFVEQGFT